MGRARCRIVLPDAMLDSSPLFRIEFFEIGDGHWLRISMEAGDPWNHLSGSHPFASVEISPCRVNAVFDTKADVCIRDKRQLGLSMRQLIIASLHQAADTLNRVLAAYVSGRGDVPRFQRTSDVARTARQRVNSRYSTEGRSISSLGTSSRRARSA